MLLDPALRAPNVRGEAVKLPAAGTMLRLDHMSAQFSQPTRARFVRLNTEWESSYDGWAWVDLLMIDDAGEATGKRSVFLPLDRLVRSATP